GTSLSAFAHPRWRLPLAPGEIVPAVVTATIGQVMEARVGPYTTTLSSSDFAWTGQRNASALVRRGDLIDVRVVSIDPDDHRLVATLEQEPMVEGALLALDNRSGAVLAMTGGYSFQRSQFNRATQAKRQLGSLFKSILFAAAIDRGYSPVSILLDEPTSFDNGLGQSRYAPRNYKRDHLGPITLRTALEKSRNIPAVRLMRDIGPRSVVAYARRFGFVSEIPPYLSVALGSSEATLEEITSAYTVFPNNGVRMPPFRIMTISDQHGTVLEEHRPAAEQAIPSDTAFVMVNLLRGVVDRGTGVAAQTLEWPVAGKTGTVDDYTDGWFVGFDPDITVGVWVGFDRKRTLGAGQDGASVALPIWHDFMRVYTEDGDTSRQFIAPSNVVFTTVDATTGAVADIAHPNAIREAFITGTEPGISRAP
ncbi:MAG: penicillin-binding transpeptidase domain-containing protein, partial [Acidobacteriota bacterium]|nr:penicillin-binding transpeptidase domain-containing protein [Acidobacteriota bacterium]